MSEDQQQTIIEALKRLPPRPDTSEEKLGYHAQRIQIDLHTVAQGRWKHSPPKSAATEIDNYWKALRRLTEVVADMSQEALDQLETTYWSEQARGEFRREPTRPVKNITIEPESPALGILPHCLQPNGHEYLLHAAKRAADNLRDATRKPGNNPRGPCIVCGHEITDADKPDCIPVSGPKGTPDRYLCPNLTCYRRWLYGYPGVV